MGGNLSKDVFERRTSTGSESFSLFICLDANKFVLLSFFSLTTTIYPRVSTEPLPNIAKSPLPVDGRRSKTLLLKLPNREFTQRRRRRQRQLCTCITLFCSFLCRRCTTTAGNCLISRFVENGNKRQQLSFCYSEL